MENRLSLQKLAERLARRENVSRKDAETFSRTFFEIIGQGLVEDKFVKVKGFGTFKIVAVGERESVDVNTGERIQIGGHSKIAFTPDSLLKDLINKPFSHFQTVVLNDNTDLEEMERIDAMEAERSEEVADKSAETSDLAAGEVPVVPPAVADIAADKCLPDEEKPVPASAEISEESASSAETSEKKSGLPLIFFEQEESINETPEADEVPQPHIEVPEEPAQIAETPAAVSEVIEEEVPEKPVQVLEEPAQIAETPAAISEVIEEEVPEEPVQVPEEPAQIAETPAVISEVIEEEVPEEPMQVIEEPAQIAEMPSAISEVIEEEMPEEPEKPAASSPRKPVAAPVAAAPVAADEGCNGASNCVRRTNWWKVSTLLLLTLILAVSCYFAGYFRLFSSAEPTSAPLSSPAPTSQPQPAAAPQPATPAATAPSTQPEVPQPAAETPATAAATADKAPQQAPQSQPAATQTAAATPHKAAATAPAAKAGSGKSAAAQPVQSRPQIPQPQSSDKYRIVGTRQPYTISRGETIRSIAEIVYGSKGYAPYIIRYNGIKNADNVAPGTVILLPELEPNTP